MNKLGYTGAPDRTEELTGEILWEWVCYIDDGGDKPQMLICDAAMFYCPHITSSVVEK